MKLLFPTRGDQTLLRSALLSLLPFLIAGPLRLIVNFQPGWNPEERGWNYLLFLLLSFLMVAGGFVLGAVKQFPRWSYPYVIYLSFSLYTLMMYAVYMFQWHIKGRNSFILMLVVLLLVLWLPGLRSFYRNISKDWTLVSYGLFGLVLFLLSTIDKDETPVLNFLVLLPSILTLFAAFGHLRTRSTMLRMAVLLAGTFAGLFIWLIPIYLGMVTVWAGIGVGLFVLLAYGVILMAILLSPLLVTVAIQIMRGSGEREL